MSEPLAFDVRREPALYEVRSLESSSVCWIDTRTWPARYMRIAAKNSTPLRLDGRWRTLLWIQAEEVAWDGAAIIPDEEIDYFDVQPWTVRVGSQHLLLSPDRTPGRAPLYWLRPSPCRELIQHKDPPGWVDWILGQLDSTMRELSS